MTDALAALVPRIRAAADEIEAGRRVPLGIVHALADAGVFRLCVPRALGGLEAHPGTLVDALATVAAADGSAGWCAMIGATSGIVSAYLLDAVAREIYGDPRTITGGVYAPRGVAVAEGEGFRVSGRWPFASGSEHCAWLMGGCLVRDDGPPRARMMLFPASEVRILDTWTVAGLRGTGSHDMTVENVYVPAERSVSLTDDAPRAAGSLYAFPVFGLLALGIAAVALGIARAAIDELVRLAREKSPQGSKRTLADRPTIQTHVAEAEALVRSGRAFLADAIAQAWSAAESESPATRVAGAPGGAAPSDYRGAKAAPPGALAARGLAKTDRALLRLAATHATTNAARATDLMYGAGGGTSIYATSPLQRCFRDVHVATQHMMVAEPTLELTGRVLLGLDADLSQL